MNSVSWVLVWQHFYVISEVLFRQTNEKRWWQTGQWEFCPYYYWKHDAPRINFSNNYRCMRCHNTENRLRLSHVTPALKPVSGLRPLLSSLCCDSSWVDIDGNNQLLRGGVVWAPQQVTFNPILFSIFPFCLIRGTNPGRFRTVSLECDVSAGRMIAFSRLSVFLTVNQILLRNVRIQLMHFFQFKAVTVVKFKIKLLIPFGKASSTK